MKSDKELKALAEPIVEVYNDIEHDLLLKIASFFKLDEGVTIKNSLDWYFAKLEELGTLNSEAIKIISKYSSMSEKRIRQLLKEAGYGSISKERLNVLNDNNITSIAWDKLLSSADINHAINNSFTEISDVFKMINTKALESTKKSYMNALNQARLEVTTGIYDYNTAIKRAIEKMVDDGISGATYQRKNGVTYQMSLEAVVRRDMITAIYQTFNSGSEVIAKELDAEYYEVSSHLGARLGDGKNPISNHFSWQGKIYKIHGSDDKYKNFYEVTGYGNILGLSGVNCRHKFWAFYPGIDEPSQPEYSYEDNKRVVELQNKQRAYECKIRKCKTNRDIYKQLGSNEDLVKWKNKQRTLNEKYNNFLKENNLTRDYSKESAIKRNVANYEDITQEWLKETPTNISKVSDLNYFKYDGVEYKVDGKNVVLDYSPKEKEVAEWLSIKFDDDVYMVPRINNPEGIATPDYMFKEKYWDLKEIKGKGKRTIDSAIKGKEKQSHNFILDISESKLLESELLGQARKVYNTKGREWVDTIIIKKHSQLLAVYKKRS